jgi:pimeloyl-ACP methyl ester carboxylesterase
VKSVCLRTVLALCVAGALTGIGILASYYPVVSSAIRYAFWKFDSGVEMTSGTVAHDNTRIHYTTFGDGPALFLLHGGLSSGLDWLGEIPDLSHKFRVVVVDLRGHGKSTMGPEPLTYRLMAADVLAVLDKLEIDRANIAGWSDGGNVGLLFALEYPERIARLIAISANFSPDGLDSDIAGSIAGTPEQFGSSFSRWLRNLRSPEPGKWYELLKRVTAMWRTYPQLDPSDLQRIAAPTLVVVGASDHVVRSHAIAMAHSIPDARLLIVPGVGHAVPRDAPALLTEEILNFLGE